LMPPINTPKEIFEQFFNDLALILSQKNN